MTRLSYQSIKVLCDVITGDRINGGETPPVAPYRSGRALENFFRCLNLYFTVGGDARWRAVENFLLELNKGSRDAEMDRIILAAVDYRDYLETEFDVNRAIEYINNRLEHDGLKVRRSEKTSRIIQLKTGAPSVASLREATDHLNLDSVAEFFERALEEAGTNPDGALTAACSTVESVCKCILDELGVPYPSKPDIGSLVKAVTNELNLSPSREDLPEDSKTDIKRILGGLVAVTGGIGALRTHEGDAHGKGKRRVKIDSRIARLAVHAASTVSVFFLETWQRQQQKKA